jgi:pentafunctional AROM polypeptide
VSALDPLGIPLLTYAIPPGEQEKHRATKSKLEDWMLSQGCTRDTLLITLGGGVVCDLVGFVAATYMRGIRILHLPTTLLAMVDAAIGGKTALDVPAGKNLIGAFHQPLHVFIDLIYLSTLPERHICNGMAEIIKIAAIRDTDLFAYLESHSESILQGLKSGTPSPKLLWMIAQGARLKADIVSQDEREGGLRELLNFGHTVGHAIEASWMPHVLHGECVSMGVLYEAEISRALGYCSETTLGRLSQCLSSYHLPTHLRDRRLPSGLAFPLAHDLMKFIVVDKKVMANALRMVLIKDIGSSVELKASPVPSHLVQSILSPSVKVLPLKSIPDARDPIEIRVPGSKSISNRALILAALSSGPPVQLCNLLLSDDTQVMLTALGRLKACEYHWDSEALVVQGHGGKCQSLSKDEDPIYLGNAGTAARFLTVFSLLCESKTAARVTRLTGNARMLQRPIGPLVSALNQNQCQIQYEGTNGCFPLVIPALGGLPGGEIQLSASISSQYVSAILLCAPYARKPVTLVLQGDKVISQPYIDMTLGT